MLNTTVESRHTRTALGGCVMQWVVGTSQHGHPMQVNCSAGRCVQGGAVGWWIKRASESGITRVLEEQPPSASCASFPADPPPQLVPVPNVTVSPGETAILSCQVLGEAPYNLTWVRDWRVLSASAGRVTQLTNLSLELSGVIPSDSGRYQCMASNSNGVTRASVWLLVRGEAAALPPPYTA